MKTGILIGFKGTFNEWIIDVLVEKKNGKSIMLKPEKYRTYREVTRMKWRDFQIEEEGLDSSYEVFEVSSIQLEEQVYDIARVGDMKKDAVYRVVYREDQEWEGIYHIRLKGRNLNVNTMDKVDDLEVIYVNQIQNDEVKRVNVNDEEKRQILQEIEEDVIQDISRVIICR